MQAYAELEISLRRAEGGRYAVELRFGYTDSDTDERSARDGEVRFDFVRLRALELDAHQYGHALSSDFFADAGLRADCTKALTFAQARSVPLRLRLFINANAPELHNLRWEMARNLDDDSLLFTGEHILFSRYLSSSDWRPVDLRARGDLRALVAVANPADLSCYRLAPIQVKDELQRSRSGLAGIPISELAGFGQVTMSNLIDKLRNGYDVLYLVCHGALVDGKPWLWLEDQAGLTMRTAGTDFIDAIKDLEQRPRLVVLASCQGAGTGADARVGDAGALAALGPRLAEAGVPAVLAMQGDVSVQTVSEFMPAFFRELQRDGQLDRAMAVARGTVRDRPDSWAPVLYMRLRSGRLWYVAGFADDGQEAVRWPSLLRRIREGRCTPILGPGMLESFIGPLRDLARRWAEQYQFPMEFSDRDDLPQVAQYLSVHQDFDFPRGELLEYARRELLRRFGGELSYVPRDATLEQWARAVGARLRERDPSEPHRVLAQLPLALYLTASPADSLSDALHEVGRGPETEVCRWRVNDEWEAPPLVRDTEPGYVPTYQRPMVYHLFGHLQRPRSVVITEDDYFDYLIGSTARRDLIPPYVRRALTDSALIFLGFQLDEWAFRVLFRSIMRLEGGSRRKVYRHVAVQINPEEGRIQEPERARRYLEEYFSGADVSIFWGTAAEFAKELWRRWTSGEAEWKP
jgi:hypothetical protein